jgi:hypothetical protein
VVLVHRVHRVHKDHKDHRVHKVLLVHRDHKDRKVLKVQQVLASLFKELWRMLEICQVAQLMVMHISFLLMDIYMFMTPQLLDGSMRVQLLDHKDHKVLKDHRVHRVHRV